MGQCAFSISQHPKALQLALPESRGRNGGVGGREGLRNPMQCINIRHRYHHDELQTFAITFQTSFMK